MAKETKKPAPTAEEKKAAKKERAKNKGPRQNYVPITSNADNTRVRALHVRGKGVLVETTLLGSKGEPISVATTWIEGLKPKSKKEDKFLVIDKGPKPKKDKKEKAGKK